MQKNRIFTINSSKENLMITHHGIAHYYVKDKPRIKRNRHFWQHNERGT